MFFSLTRFLFVLRVDLQHKICYQNVLFIFADILLKNRVCATTFYMVLSHVFVSVTPLVCVVATACVCSLKHHYKQQGSYI